MNITVNGEEKVCEEGISLEMWVLQNGYDKKKIAVERNGNIVPKAEYENCLLGPADKLEVVTFVGGG
ncbi:MAG: sulfur carrier protein ThiS [Butyribacter sp.]|nr:sulfur carrier protein ThiS [bacterium]MDY3853595.1 sulfur carrier protein ThiS [Butyribacter sp.]